MQCTQTCNKADANPTGSHTHFTHTVISFSKHPGACLDEDSCRGYRTLGYRINAVCIGTPHHCKGPTLLLSASDASCVLLFLLCRFIALVEQLAASGVLEQLRLTPLMVAGVAKDGYTQVRLCYLSMFNYQSLACKISLK